MIVSSTRLQGTQNTLRLLPRRSHSNATVPQTMLSKRQFVDLKQLNETIQRVWGNCMQYNYEKSDIWAQAASAAK